MSGPQSGGGLQTPASVVQRSPAAHCALDAHGFGHWLISQPQVPVDERRQRPVGPAIVTPSGHNLLGMPSSGPHLSGSHTVDSHPQPHAFENMRSFGSQANFTCMHCWGSRAT
jgi:hypothetical protein